MIPLNLTIKDEVQQIEIPSTWEEITVKQYRAMTRNVGDLSPLRILAILMNIDYDTIMNFRSNSIDQIMLHLGFIAQVPVLEDAPRPDKITIGGKEMPRIVKIENERIGQKILLTQLMNHSVDNNVPKIEILNEVLAIYYCDQFHPKKEWNEAIKDEVALMVDDMPILEAYAEANFFFRKWLRPLPKNQSTSLQDLSHEHLNN